MITLQFPEKTPSNEHDWDTKRALLNRFTAQIAPPIHDQSTLLCAAISPILVHQSLIELYLKHIHIKTSPNPVPNEQLDFLFNGFTPVAEASSCPLSLEELLNLIQTGDKDTKPPEGTQNLFPAPLKDLPEVETVLTDLIADQMIYICTDLTLKLALSTDETPIDDQVKRMITKTITSLLAFLPEESEETADQPSGVANESDETTKEKIK